MNVAEALLHGLKAYGAGEVFGIPGDFALPFFKVMEESRILPLHTLSHEPAVGFAADAAGRFRGGIGVAAVTYGAGAFNLVNAVSGAFAEKSPVVVVSGAPGRAESRSGLLLHHQGRTLDTQFRVYQEVTCAQARLDDPATAPAEIARVLTAAIDQARPVYLELPRDMVGAPCGPVPGYAATPPDPEAVAACADEIMARLAEAKRPVVHGRRRGAALRPGGQGGRADPARWASRSPPPSWAAVCSDHHRRAARRHLPRRRRRPGRDRAGRGLGRAAAPGRDPERHQLRRQRRPARPAPDHAGARPPGRHGLPRRTATSRSPALVDALLARAHALGPRRPGAGPGLPARPRRRRRRHRARRHRPRHQRPVRPPRADADRGRHRRLPVHRDGDRPHRPHRPRLLRRHGLRRAGRDRRPARDRPAAR